MNRSVVEISVRNKVPRAIPVASDLTVTRVNTIPPMSRREYVINKIERYRLQKTAQSLGRRATVFRKHVRPRAAERVKLHQQLRQSRGHQSNGSGCGTPTTPGQGDNRVQRYRRQPWRRLGRSQRAL